MPTTFFLKNIDASLLRAPADTCRRFFQRYDISIELNFLEINKAFDVSEDFIGEKLLELFVS